MVVEMDFKSSIVMLVLICELFLLQQVPIFVDQQSAALNKLDVVITDYTLVSDSMAQALTQMARDFKLPMGIEWIRDAATSYRVDRSWRHAKVYNIIQSVVNIYPGYECRVINGVVQVYPQRFENDPSDLLNLRVSKFESDQEWLALASNRLQLMVKPLIRHVEPAPPDSGEAGSFVIGMGGKRPVTVRLEDANVREILSSLVLSAGETNWIVTYSEDAPVTTKGYHQTADLFSTAPPSDDHQPVWVLLPWAVSLPGRVRR